MKKAFLVILLSVFVTSAFSQTNDLGLIGFKGIDVFGPFEVELIKATDERVEITYNGIPKEHVIAEVYRGILKLKLKNKHYFEEWDERSYRKSDYATVKIYYYDLDEIKAQAGAVVKSTDRLKSKYLTIESSMGAEVMLTILTKEVQTKTAMGGILRLSGQADVLDAKASMGGELKAAALESKIVYVKATMGSEVMVNAINELEASSSFGSVIHYTGGATVLHTNKNMGGEVYRKN